MTWATAADVENALGSTPVDSTYLAMCVDAANAWAFRRRATAGYHDDPAVAPDPAVALGTTLYAQALYRERGAVDGYASFEDLAAGFVPTGTSTQINRLLGIGKPVAS
jgi:hypothetical protein